MLKKTFSRRYLLTPLLSGGITLQSMYPLADRVGAKGLIRTFKRHFHNIKQIIEMKVSSVCFAKLMLQLQTLGHNLSDINICLDWRLFKFIQLLAISQI